MNKNIEGEVRTNSWTSLFQASPRLCLYSSMGTGNSGTADFMSIPLDAIRRQF